MNHKLKINEVDSVRWLGTLTPEIQNFLNGYEYEVSYSFLEIITKNKTIIVPLNNYILKGNNGEFYSCDEHLFKFLFE